MARTKTKKRARRKPGKKTRKQGLRRRLLLPVMVATLVVFGLYVAYLDYSIRSQFDGRRWDLPARVYARPLELFLGMRLPANDLERELSLLRYAKQPSAREPGSYARLGNEFRLATRPFAFWDGNEPSRPIRLRIEGDTLASIENGEGEVLPLVRLDPALIGSIYPAHNEDRILVELKDVPAKLVEGLMAVEDRHFYDHYGVSPLAIGRALLVNLRAGGTVQGGSTLTQQLVKNFFLTNDRTLWRKANEAVMSLLLEWHYDKSDILESYLNEVYLAQDGNRAIHGFGLASQFYFQRPLSKLALNEQALLVGLVKGPSYYDPRRHPERARARRDRVLEIWAERGLITGAQAQSEKSKSLGVSRRAPSGVTHYPAFLDLVRRQLRRDYREDDLTSAGLQIFTTLDPSVQHHAERSLSTQIERLEKGYNIEPGELQGAIVITRSDSGEIVAAVGGREPAFAGFNRALDAVRPIGSLVKPAVFLAAVSRPDRYTLATLIDDSELSVPNGDGSFWSPQNYDKLNHGAVPLYQALAHSYNVSTARLGLEVGVDAVAETIQRLGVSRPVTRYPSLFLGALSLSPLEVAEMYQTIAGGGFRSPLRSIRAVLDAHGRPLSRYPLTVEQAFDPEPVHLLAKGLEKVAEEGTAQALYTLLPKDLKVAGKTGTTDDLRDSWFAGFTDDYVAVVWLGRDDNQSIRLTGSTGALWVWGQAMQSLQARSLALAAPARIEDVWIDPVSGLLSDAGCNGAVELPFIEGSAPTEHASCTGGGPKWLRRLLD